MSNKVNNLNDLLQRFVRADADEAKIMAEDIRQGDALLDRYSSPAMSSEAAARVRTRLRTAVADRRRVKRRVRWISLSASVAAAAAMVLLFVGPSEVTPTQTEPPAIVQAPTPPAEVRTPERRTLDRSELPGFTLNLWDDGHHTDSDQAFAAIKSELDDIAAWIDTVGLMDSPFSDEPLLNGQTAGQRKDQDLSAEFWKG